MKKILASLTLGVLLLPVVVSAQTPPSDPGTVVETIQVLIDWLFYILIFAAVVVILLAAYTFLTAAGDPDKVKKARDYILYSLIALVVAFLARAIVNWLLEQIGVSSTV
jgi:heme O synthase-like polyprenyltransferase